MTGAACPPDTISQLHLRVSKVIINVAKCSNWYFAIINVFLLKCWNDYKDRAALIAVRKKQLCQIRVNEKVTNPCQRAGHSGK